MKWHRDTFRITEAGGVSRTALIIGIAGLALSGVGFAVDQPRFFHAWLTSFAYWTSLGLCALFFTMLHHLVGARWSVVIRRLSESLAQTLPIMAVLFIPILFGLHDLYHWSHHEAVAADPALAKKAGYLNSTFFVIRTVVFFALWSVFARLLYTLSLKEDAGYTPEHSMKMKRVAGLGMVLFAFTVTYAAFDWLMSLDPHRYSTIFGVLYFSAGLVSLVSLMALIVILLTRRGIMADVISVEHRHDLGKLMLAFTIFWAYIAFSQYFLIWYGNIPEETVWYMNRWVGSWKTISMILLFGHFFIPFVALLFRGTKRNPLALAIAAIWILVMHWFNMFWLVYPTLLPEGATFSWLDLTTMAGIGGIFIWWFWRQFTAGPAVAMGDPKLAGSIEHVNPF